MDSQEKYDFLKKGLHYDPVLNSAIFSILRALKVKNPGDTYLENYLWHFEKRGCTFFDVYHLMRIIGSCIRPLSVMEIGCRTGISICQLLSAYTTGFPLKIVLFDIFSDPLLSPELVKINMKHLGLSTDNVEFVTGDSLVQVPEYKKSYPDIKFDYILVDGCHDKAPAFEDLNNVKDMLYPGGILLFDDIAPDGCNLLDVWDAFCGENKHEFLFLQNLDGKGVGVGVKK